MYVLYIKVWELPSRCEIATLLFSLFHFNILAFMPVKSDHLPPISVALLSLEFVELF
jgi:hypothetical protein